MSTRIELERRIAEADEQAEAHREARNGHIGRYQKALGSGYPHQIRAAAGFAKAAQQQITLWEERAQALRDSLRTLTPEEEAADAALRQSARERALANRARRADRSKA
jgi:hypothetical protein